MAFTLDIALTQLNLAWEQPEANQAKAAACLSGAPDADLLVLPEMWATGFTMNTAKAEPAEGPSFQWMKEQSAKNDLFIAGSISIREGDQFYNRFYCTGPNGKIAQYDKRHLFSFGHEDNYYSAGQRHSPFQIDDWRIMPIICYDLRFPVWCRNTDTYDVLLVVANWPEVRIHHWDALLRARAIENQCFVVAVNRIGKDPNNLYHPGHSSVYDMNGTCLLMMDEKVEGTSLVRLEREPLDQFRQKYRFLQDRDRFNL